MIKLQIHFLSKLTILSGKSNDFQRNQGTKAMSHCGRSRLGRGGGRSGRTFQGSDETTSSAAAAPARLPVVRQHAGGSSSNTTVPPTNLDSWTQEPTGFEEIEDWFNEQHDEATDQITLEDLLRDDTRARELPKLDPFPKDGTTWFSRDRNSRISKHISTIIRGGYKDAYMSWTNTPPQVRDQFFVKFAQIYYWIPSITHTVREEFDKIGTKRMKGITSQIKKEGKCPGWMTLNVYEKLCERWATEAAQAKSVKTRAARFSDRDGCGPHKHVAGQKSFYTVQCDLEDQYKKPATISEVFKKTHTDPKTGSFVDLKAKQISESYEQKKSEFLQSQMDSNTDLSDGASQTVQLTPDQENELFLQSTLPDRRGNVYGLGTLSHQFRAGKNKGIAASTVTDTITEIEQRMEAYKQDVQQEMASYRENINFLTQQNQQLLAYLQSALPSFPAHFTSMPPPPPPAPPRHDGSGSSSATGQPDDFPPEL